MHHLCFLAIRNRVAMNICVRFHEDVCFNFFEYKPKSEIKGSKCNSVEYKLKSELKGQDVTFVFIFMKMLCFNFLNINLRVKLKGQNVTLLSLSCV